MSFIDFNFVLIFIPACFAIYYIFRNRVKLQNMVIMCASLLFYASYGLHNMIYVLWCVLITYISGILAARFDKHRKSIAVAGSVLNIGMLVWAKSNRFLIRILNIMFGIDATGILQQHGIEPVVGMAFFVLQSSTYLFAVYSGTMKPRKNFINHVIFVTFFPTMISGPIQRAEELFPQIENKRNITWENVKEASILFIMGAFMKLMVANRLAKYTDFMFTNNDLFSSYGFYLVLAVVLYSIQIYADFAGYSNMAIAVARLFGFKIKDNFNSPYLAVSIADFWRRWHISFSSWLRDYIYIPLGGNRKGNFRKCVNIFIVFIISGLWHGVSLGYIVWGMLHAIYQILSICTKKLRYAITEKLKINRDNIVYIFIQRIFVFVLVSFAWIFFRLGSLSQSVDFLKKMFCQFNPQILYNGDLYWYMEKYHWIIGGISVIFMAVVSLVGKWRIIKTLAACKEMLLAAIIIITFLILIVFGVYGPAYSASNFIYAGF